MKDMNEKEILRHVDHTLLSQEAVWDEIRQVCDDAVKYDTASVCIPPSYVKQAAEYVGGRVPICTVIGFPNGYNTTAVKVFETKDAIANGANEAAVALFLEGKIGFLDIPKLIKKAMINIPNKQNINIDDVFNADKMARELVLKG